MIEYQDLIADHQALQKQLADQPEAVDVERVLQLIAQIRDAGTYIGDPQQRDQLRTILRYWWAFVYERTAEYTPTQLAPYEARGLRAWRIPGLAAGATPWWAWAVVGLLALVIFALVVWILSSGGLVDLTAGPQAGTFVFGDAGVHATETALAETVTAYAEALVTVDPPSTEVTIGATTTVNIRIENVANLYGAEVQLVFNPALLEVVDADSALEGVQIQPGPFLSPDFVARNNVDQATGRIVFAVAQMPPHAPASAGGILATITFRGKAAGVSLLRFPATRPTPPAILSDRDGRLIGTRTRSGSIVVTGWPSPTPTFTPTPVPTFGPTPTPSPGAIQPENASELRPLAQIRAHEGAILQVAFSPDSRLLASSGADGTVRLWSVPAGKEVSSPLTAHKGWVQGLAFSPDNRWLASGGNDGVVILWDASSLQPFAMWSDRKGFIFDLAFSPDGRLLASGSGDGTVTLWDVESGSEVNVIMDGEKAVYGVTFSPDGTRLATANVAGTVREWDTATGAEFCTFSTVALPPGPVLSVAFAPDGRFLAAGDTAGQIIILDSYTCAAQQILEAHADNVNAVAYSPDGRVLASGSRDTTVKIWPMVSAPITLSGHEDSVEAVAFSPDGRLLASAGADGTIILWGLEGP